MATTSNTNDFNDCYEVISLLETLVDTHAEKSGGEVNINSDGSKIHISPTSTYINRAKVTEVLNEILIGGLIREIGCSGNQKLISKFYKTLQNLYADLEQLGYRYTDEELKNIHVDVPMDELTDTTSSSPNSSDVSISITSS